MNDEQLLRYNRHILLPEIDVVGQQELLDARAVIVGIGGLGSPAALYLASAGIGRLTLIDFDEVELSNLQRQILHHESDIGRLKTDSARDSLHDINAGTTVDIISGKPDFDTLRGLFTDADIVLDGTDNFASRQLINQACVQTKTPLVSGAAIRFEGQLSVFDSRDDDCPCYACLYGDSSDDDEQNCTNNGILSPVVGIIGTAMATETIKMICGIGKPLKGRLLLLDALNMEWREMHLKRDPGCSICGK